MTSSSSRTSETISTACSSQYASFFQISLPSYFNLLDSCVLISFKFTFLSAIGIMDMQFIA